MFDWVLNVPPWWKIRVFWGILINKSVEYGQRIRHEKIKLWQPCPSHNFMLKNEDEDVDLVPSGTESALNTLPWPWFLNLPVANFKIKKIIPLDLSQFCEVKNLNEYKLKSITICKLRVIFYNLLFASCEFNLWVVS